MASFWSDTLVAFLESLASTEGYTAIATESVQERSVEAGYAWVVTHTESLSQGGSSYLQLTTPATDYLITLHNVQVSAGSKSLTSKYVVYEGATTTGGTTTGFWISNLNRNATTAKQFDIVDNPTVTDEGTKIEEVFIGDIGVSGLSNPSYQLKPSTKYLIEVYNLNSTGAETFNTKFHVYQIPNN